MLGPGGTKKRPLAKITGAEHNKYDETIRDMEQERAIMAMKIEKLQRANEELAEQNEPVNEFKI